jgi:hypothetical protein
VAELPALPAEIAATALDPLERRVAMSATLYRDWPENHPDFDSVRDHPRYEAILERIGWRSRRYVRFVRQVLPRVRRAARCRADFVEGATQGRGRERSQIAGVPSCCNGCSSGK